MISILKKTIPVLLCSVMSLSAFASLAYAEELTIDPADSFIYDEADMLTEQQETELGEKITETAEYINMNILIYVSGTTIGSHSGTVQFAEELCLEYFGYDADSIVLYMDLSGHDNPNYAPYDYIYTRNLARFYYSGESDVSDGGRIDAIFDYMNPYLPRCEEDVYSATEAFLNRLEMFYDYGPDPAVEYFYIPDKDMYAVIQDDNTILLQESKPKSWGLAVVIGIVAGLIAAVITFITVKMHYRFKSQPSSLQYMDFENAHLEQKSDMFIRSYQTRTRIQTSSGGGGGGGTSSGGGGGGNSR